MSEPRGFNDKDGGGNGSSSGWSGGTGSGAGSGSGWSGGNGSGGNWKGGAGGNGKRVSFETTGAKGALADAPVTLIIAWVAFVAMIACNFAFEALPLGGLTTAEVSNQVFVWFTPAGYAFAIWTLIYIGLAVWLVALTRDELRFGRASGTTSILFSVTCVFNVLWLALFHLQHIGLSLVAIILYWVAVALLYGLMHVPGKSMLLTAPLSLYLGWLTVATVINATNLVTRAVGSISLVNEASAIILSLVVLIMGVAMAKLAGDYVFPAVLLWAVVAVGVHLVDVNAYVASAIFTLCVISALITYLPLGRLMNRGDAPKARA